MPRFVASPSFPLYNHVFGILSRIDVRNAYRFRTPGRDVPLFMTYIFFHLGHPMCRKSVRGRKLGSRRRGEGEA